MAPDRTSVVVDAGEPLLLVRRVDQFSPSRGDHLVATATCCSCCCCCCCVATILLTGVTWEKGLTASIVDRAPRDVAPTAVAVRHRGARWLAGASPFLACAGVPAVLAVLGVPPTAFVFLLALVPVVAVLLLRYAYIRSDAPPPSLVVRGIIFTALFIGEGIAGFATIGVAGIASAIGGVIIFLARAAMPPRRAEPVTWPRAIPPSA